MYRGSTISQVVSFSAFYRAFLLKWGILHLTLSVKIGYNAVMFREMVSFILRIGLIIALWAFVWGLVRPRTQLLRILRAVLLLLGSLGILAVLRIAA